MGLYLGFQTFQCVCMGGFPTSTSNSPDTSRVSCHLTQFWHFLPRYSIRFYRLRGHTAPLLPSEASCKLRLLTLAVDHRVSHTPSLASINLPEQLIQFRKTFYLLDYQFILKGYNSGTNRLKRCMGKVWGKDIPLFQHLQLCTNL